MLEKKRGLINRPQVNLSLAASKRMWLIFAAASLTVFQSSLTDGGRSLIVGLAVLITALALELILTWRQSGFDKVKDGSAAASAAVLTLLLPNQIAPMYGALAAVFAVLVVKFSSGGLGSNWLNPALGGWLFARLSWPAAFSSALADSPYYSQGAWLSAPAASFDTVFTAFLNRNVFHLVGAEVPAGYFELLALRDPAVIADRGILALLAGSVALTALRVGRFYMPLVFLFVFGFLSRFLGDISFGGQLWAGDIFLSFFSGGTIAAAFILVAEPSSGAKTKYGALASAALAAALAWVFRYLALDYFGVFTAVAFVNCLSPLIRLAEGKLFFSSGGAGVKGAV